MSQNQRPLIAAKIPHEWMEQVDRICQQTGQSRSQVLQEAISRRLDAESFGHAQGTRIATYLGQPEVNSVEERVSALEVELRAVNQQLTQLTQAIEELTQILGSKTPRELTHGLTELTRQPVQSKPSPPKQTPAQKEDGEWMTTGEAFRYLGGDPNNFDTKVVSASGRTVGFRAFGKIKSAEEYRDFGLESHFEQHGKLVKAKFRPIVGGG